MEPPRPPPGNNGPAGPGGSGNKSQPSVFPMPPATRGYPQPALLQQRIGGGTAEDNETSDTNDAEMKRKAAANAAEEEEEDPCLICHENLPDVGRGIIIGCGHVFCFSHILTWSKTETKCPVCRRQFMSITKTLDERDVARKNAREARFKYRMRKNEMDKKQIDRERRKLASYKTPLIWKLCRKSPGKNCHRQMQKKYVATKIIRVRPCSQEKTYTRQLRNAPHPQAPGGIFHEASIQRAPIAVSPSLSVRNQHNPLLRAGVQPHQVDREVLQQATRARNTTAALPPHLPAPTRAALAASAPVTTRLAQTRIMEQRERVEVAHGGIIPEVLGGSSPTFVPSPAPPATAPTDGVFSDAVDSSAVARARVSDEEGGGAR